MNCAHHSTYIKPSQPRYGFLLILFWLTTYTPIGIIYTYTHMGIYGRGLRKSAGVRPAGKDEGRNKMLEKTEKMLEWGGMKKDIICVGYQDI